MKKRNKILAAIFGSMLCAMSFGMIGCASGTDTPDEGKNPPIEDTTPEWEKDGSLKILMIGNSFTDNTMTYTYQICQDLGIQNVYLAYLYIGGSNLTQHYENAIYNKANYEYRVNSTGTRVDTPNYKIGDALKEQDWDFISIQQLGLYAGQHNKYNDLNNFVSYIKENVKEGSNPKLVWNFVWPYKDTYNDVNFQTWYGTGEKMYECNVQCVKDIVAPNAANFIIIPNGTAIMNARSSFIGLNLYADSQHMNAKGQYIAGLTLISKLTGKDISGIRFAPAGVSAMEKLVAIESVKNALENPYEITQSEFI